MKADLNQMNETEFIIEDLDNDPEISRNMPEVELLNRQKEDEDKEKGSQAKTRSIQQELVSWVLNFAIAIVVALILKNYVIINAKVPTGSMENTIQPGDDLFGFRLSYIFSEPKRGDIIIFKYPDDETQKYVKRVIGLPGDTVVIEDAMVYINGSTEPLDESYLKEKWIKDTGPYEFVVPEDSYFVMGDNRNSSWDSRYWMNTFVSKDKIIGKAIFVYFPFSRFGTLQ